MKSITWPQNRKAETQIQTNEDFKEKQKMKGKINKDGILEIERAGEFKKQICMKNMTGESPGFLDSYPCSDNCSLFGEPETDVINASADWERLKIQTTGRTFLGLCEQTWYFDEFEDER